MTDTLIETSIAAFFGGLIGGSLGVWIVNKIIERLER